MSYDLKLTHCSLRLGRRVSIDSLPIEEEGLLLCRTLEDGIEKVTLLASPTTDDQVVGYSVLGDALPQWTSEVEQIVVPTTTTFVEVDLRNNNLILNMVRAVVVGGTALTIDYTYAGAPAPGTVKVDIANGKLKFDAAQSGDTVDVTYRYELTLSQAKQKFGERFFNNFGLHAEFGQLEIGAGLAELWTDAFDSSLDYSAGAPLYLGANGIITTTPGGPALNAVVIGIPNSDNPRLGVRIQFVP